MLSNLDSDSLDLFLCNDLIVADWQLATNFPTAGSTNFSWVDSDTNGEYDPLDGDIPVDMGVRGLVPIIE